MINNPALFSCIIAQHCVLYTFYLQLPAVAARYLGFGVRILMPISVVVACGNSLESELLSAALKQQSNHFDVVGTAFSSQELLKQVTEHHPQVTVVSAALEDGPKAGLKALRKLRASNSSTRPVVLLDSSDSEKVLDAFSAGAKGVVCKTSPFSVLCKCLESVHAGQIWADSAQLQWICETLGKWEPARIVSTKDISLLTKREEEIAHMVAEGLPNHEISSKLGVSPHTVKNHLFRIYEKLGISNRVELVLYALSSREGPPESSITTQGDA
jgi:DNA-binding NarL/FixJ family response regulator